MTLPTRGSENNSAQRSSVLLRVLNRSNWLVIQQMKHIKSLWKTTKGGEKIDRGEAGAESDSSTRSPAARPKRSQTRAVQEADAASAEEAAAEPEPQADREAGQRRLEPEKLKES